MRTSHYALAFLIGTAFVSENSARADAAQDAKDAAMVQAVLRLKTIDVNTRPKLKQAVLRHLSKVKDREKYVDLVEKLKIKDVDPELLKLVVAAPDSTAGVRAVTLLTRRDEPEQVKQALQSEKEALPVIKAMGLAGLSEANELLTPLVEGDAVSRPVRNAAAAALGRNRQGQTFLLNLVEQEALHEDLTFTVANALLASNVPDIKHRASKFLKLPAAASGVALPPVAELVKRRGNKELGAKLFAGKATCSKCHKVRGEGKEVGPDLSEIGSKLTREASLISILDPSAGISHNYETYAAILESGNLVSGVLVSRTDEKVTLRTAEAIDKTFPTDEIEEFQKMSTSLMPADLQKNLTADDLVNLLEYLASLKKQQ